MEKYNLCKYCLKPIELIPSATVRAKRFGGKPEDYRNMFDSHASCFVWNRSREDRDLMRKKRGMYGVKNER